MALRQRQWAERTREKIFDALGRFCNYCSTTKNLEFDVIIPADNGEHHREYDWSWRMSFYRKQLKANNLQVLCDKCNARKRNKNAEYVEKEFNFFSENLNPF